MSKTLTGNQRKYHSLMYALVYPAVLGTMLVNMLQKAASGGLNFDDGFWWSVFLILYFSSQHVENVLSIEGYTGWIFWLDLIEVAVILRLFWLLGMFSTGAAVETDWYGFSQWLLIAFLLPLATRWVTYRTLGGAGKSKSLHAGLAASLSFIAVFVGADLSLLFLLSLIFLSYMILLVFKAKPMACFHQAEQKLGEWLAKVKRG